MSKIKSIVILLIGVLFTSPITAYACGVEVVSIQPSYDLKQNVIIKEDDVGYDFGVKITGKSQTIDYKVVVTNTCDEDIVINKVDINKSDYSFLEYSFKDLAKEQEIKANETKEFSISIKSFDNKNQYGIEEDIELKLNYNTVSEKTNMRPISHIVVNSNIAFYLFSASVTLLIIMSILIVLSKSRKFKVTFRRKRFAGVSAIALVIVGIISISRTNLTEKVTVEGENRVANLLGNVSVGKVNSKAYTVTIDPNGGIFKGTGTTYSYKVEPGTKLYLTEISHDKYNFANWTFNGSVFNDTYLTVNKNVTLKANWKNKNFEKSKCPVDDIPHTIYLNPNTGKITETEVVRTTGSKYKLPSPTKRGYSFVGWVNEENESIYNNDCVKLLNDSKLTAKWTPNKYTVYLNTNGGTASKYQMTVTFDGTFKGLPTPKYVNHTFRGWYTSSNRQIVNTTKIDFTKDMTISAKWTENRLNVSVTGYKGVYDGNAHSISVIPADAGTTVYYSTDGKTYSKKNPSYKNAGTYTVYYKVVKNNYFDYTGKAKVVISKAECPIKLSAKSGVVTYPSPVTVNITGACGAVSITNSNDEVVSAVLGSKKFTLTPTIYEGTSTIKVLSAETANYKAATVSYGATIKHGTIAYSAKDYNGIYDKESHAIDVTTSLEGAVITYSDDQETYKKDEIKYIDADTYTVYYKIEKPGYNTVNGNRKVKIARATCNTFALSSDAGSLVYPDKTTFNVSGACGDVSVSSGDTTIAKTSISDNTVTVASNTKKGTAKITVTSETSKNYNSKNLTYTATVDNGTIIYEAEGYTGNYDENEHGISVSTELEDTVISYSTNGKTYTSENPKFTDAGTYTVYYKIEKDGYYTVKNSEQVVINKIECTSFDISSTAATLTYPNTDEITITGACGVISAKSNNTNVATVTANDNKVTVSSNTTEGTAIITITNAESTNYLAASKIYTATVQNGDIDYVATDYNGDYDNDNHGISVTSNTQDAKIEYSTDEVTYSTTNVTYKNVGEYTVYYKITKDGYNTVTGSKKVIITKAECSELEIDETNGELTYPATKEITVSGAQGNIVVSSDDEDVATATVEGNKVTIISNTKAGTAKITITSEESDNYLSGSITYDVTVKANTIVYNAINYNGTFNGEEHGITISLETEDVSVEYSVDGQNYVNELPTYTNAGEYLVYYRLSKPGYNTETGSATVTIAKAECTEFSIDKTSGTIIYPNKDEINVTGACGVVSVTSEDEDVATATIEDTKVTVNANTKAGISTITVISGETENYLETAKEYEATIQLATIEYTPTNYNQSYDALAHGIELNITTEDVTVEYSTNGTDYTTEAPTFTNAGEYTVYYKLTKIGYETVNETATVKITKVECSTLAISKSVGYLTYPETKDLTITGACGELTVTTNNDAVATATLTDTGIRVESNTTQGIAIITVTSEESDNYLSGSVTYTVTVGDAVIVHEADNYNAVYDGNNHSIVLTTIVDDVQIEYSEDGETYVEEKPQYKNVGEYTVYYKMSKDGYETVLGSKKVIIIKAECDELEIDETEGTLVYPETKELTVTGARGNVTATSSDEEVATVTVEDSKVLISSNTKPGTATITITSEESDNYLSGTVTYEVTVEKNNISYQVIGYNSAYDDENHGITVTTYVENAKVEYSTNGIEFVEENPTYKNVGEYTVFYKITKAGYNDVTGSEKVIITKADCGMEISSNSGELTYPETKEITITGVCGSVTVVSNDEEVATATVEDNKLIVSSNTKPGSATITITSAETDNYNEVSKTYNAKVSLGDIEYSVANYTGTFDGEEHSFTLSVNTENVTVEYSLDGEEYTSTKPTFTSAGNNTIYYRLSKAGYNIVNETATVNIAKEETAITIDSTSGELTYPETKELIVTGVNGTLTATSSDEEVATVTVEDNKVKVLSNTKAGSATITITSEETDNYKSDSTTYEVTVIANTIVYSATNYNGTYDEQTHGITVTSEVNDVVIEYSYNDSEYSTTNPTFTEPGEYSVNYKITKAGYITVTGTATVTILKMDCEEFNIDKTVGTLKYPNTDTINVTGACGAVTVSSTDEEVANATYNENVVTVNSNIKAGTAKITIMSAETDIYNSSSKEYSVTVEQGDIEYSAANYTGSYDGQNHGITINSEVEGVTITYSLDDDIYTNELPTFMIGNNTVYFTITKAGYNPIKDSRTVTIDKIELNVASNPTAFDESSYEEKITLNAGDSIPLLNAGGTITGTIPGYNSKWVYAVSASADEQPTQDSFTSTIPTVTENGTYYVWYMTDEDKDVYSGGVNATSVTVTITKIEE